MVVNGHFSGSVLTHTMPPTAAPQQPTTTLNMREKKKAYAKRVRDFEYSSFTPKVMSACGGLAKQAMSFYQVFASKLATKWDQPYSLTMNLLRYIISFALQRSSIQFIFSQWSRIQKSIHRPRHNRDKNRHSLKARVIKNNHFAPNHLSCFFFGFVLF